MQVQFCVPLFGGGSALSGIGNALAGLTSARPEGLGTAPNPESD
jgi:hypothetical protein